MGNLPSSYPYLEPCPGCFENALQALSEKANNPYFVMNGDVDVCRFLHAFSRLIPKAKATLCLHAVYPSTLDCLEKMIVVGELQCATVFCTEVNVMANTWESKYPHVLICDAGCSAYLIDFEGESRSLTLSGYVPQNMGTGTLNLFTLYTDPEMCSGIRNLLKRHYKRYLSK